ncbi:MMS19 nucleotide excision repair protein homolog isoform X2 [Aegilops tauschii subsp. strangulata]|uniref:MMS19 nucleotide excision repair protein n=7 Tax=Aegilops tauschii subsp. strangulata TaxID=200361 RepID=A0A453T2X1_AEGTS|nr:MMS19 nucleotide excision repair protein homolog isoform X2 [Aegilops tauschii subsp. strangulata]
MAKVPAGEWVPHVEAFVDVSRSPAQHSAGVDALAALVNKDKLTLFDLVSKMDMYLTTTDHIVRSRGILLLGQIMSHISFKWLDVNAITTLSDFFISRLSDWQALRGALVGCLALLHRKSSVGTIMVADVKRLVEAFIADVQVQSLAAADRKMCFEIFSWILDHYPEAVKTMDDELLYWICQSIDEEKDPECLKLSFHVVEVVMKLFPDPSGFADQFASDLFEILSKYFPVYFTHGAGDNLGVTRDELSRALMHAFCASPYFEPFAIPLLLDKLSSSLPLAKLDSLKYLDNCIHCYGADRMVTHASAIWFKLKEVLFSLSSDQLLSSGSPKDAENNKNQIKSEAEHCLKTAVTYIHSPDRDIFINLILLDEDIVNNIHSVTTEEKSIDSSLQALGSVVSILAGSSTYLCTRVFQAHFKRLVDILGNSAGFDSQHLSIANGSSPAAINYGALYLSVQMLSSCREVAVASREGVPAEESWWLILEEKLDQIIHLFGKLLTIDCQPTQSAVRKECVSCAVKGLLILATIPEQCSLLLENAYEDILQMLTLVITSKYENAHFWRLSLKTLTSIGSSAVELHASKREMVYNRIVVDKIICLAESCDASMPLNLRLEACFEVGTASVNYMLRVARSLEETVIRNISQVNGSIECADYVACLIDCYSSRLLPWFFTSGGLNELALSFALRLWDEIGDLVTLDRIISEGLLESLMMGMKLLVGVCTEEQQSLIVQKACGIVSSMLSLPVKALTHHLLSVDELVPAHSVQDTALVCMLSSVIVGLWPQTPVPEMMMMINLFSVFLLNGHIPAAHALASIFNKYLQNSEFSHEIKLDKILDVILGGCFSIVLPSSNLKMSRSSAATSDNADFSDSLPGSIGSKIDILCGLAWIGKGLLMRGDEKVKEISMFLLKCLSSEASLASAAADAFHVMMGDSEVCLNKKFHARIKFLYKQRFFSILMPIFLSKIKETSELTTKLVIYRAFGHIISNAPVSAVITEAHQILLVMVDILAKLSVDNQDKDLVYSLLLVLSGMLMDEKGKECIVENIRIIISVLAQLVSYPHMMVVRETALQCFVAMSSFPHSKVYRMRPQVLQAAIKALDDKKRAVRQEAVRCRQTWQSSFA